VSDLPLPTNLVEGVERWATDEPRAWLAALPGVVRRVADEWSLTLGAPYQPGGMTAWVAPAVDAAGHDCVLKVGWVHYEAAHEADGLRLWGGDGAVVLLAHQADETTSALLLERCTPGHELGRVAAEPEQDEVVAGLLQRLWRTPPAGHPLRPLHTMCDAWATGFEARRGDLTLAVDDGLVSEAMAAFRSLPRDPVDEVMLCTDLHAANVLAAEREPWLVIDPKPYVGDRTYDVLQHMLNCRSRLCSDPLTLVRRLAGLCDLDADRLRQWTFARCVQESIDTPELYAVARAVAP
jgi:streptomycin 6-kinase